MKCSTKEEEAEREMSQESDHSKMKMNPHRRAHELKKLTKKKEEEEQDRRVKEGRQSMKAGRGQARACQFHDKVLGQSHSSTS